MRCEMLSWHTMEIYLKDILQMLVIAVLTTSPWWFKGCFLFIFWK